MLKKKCVMKKFKSKDYKNYLEVTEIENKINCIEKNKIYIDSLKTDHKEFIKK